MAFKLKHSVKFETDEQADFVGWFRFNFPDVRIFAIPNGGWRHPSSIGRLKKEGVVAGVPDLFIPAWKIWVEIKRVSGGKLSAVQSDWKQYLESVGYVVVVARGCEEAKKMVLMLIEKIT